MKNISIILASVALSVFSVHFLVKPKNIEIKHEPSKLETILNRGTLSCGYTSFPPMLIIDPNTGKISGIAHDIMQEIGKKLGVKIEWTEEAGWGDHVTALNNNRFDVFCAGGWPNSKRARSIAFTNPIIYSPLDVFVRANDYRFDNDPQNNLNKKHVKIVGIDGGTISTIAQELFNNATHYTLPDSTPISNLFIEVYSHKSDAVVMDRSSGFEFMRNNKDKIKKLDNILVRVYPNVYSINYDEVELQQALNIALGELHNAGIIKRIVTKYQPLPNSYFFVHPEYIEQ